MSDETNPNHQNFNIQRPTRNYQLDFPPYWARFRPKLVEDFVSELAHAVESLEDKVRNTRVDSYRLSSSIHLKCAADGFVFLRRSGRGDSSKFLIRPALEMAFRLEAVRKHPDLLYRIAFSEHLEDQKLLREDAKRKKQPYDDEASKQKWKTFSDEFAAEFPDLPKVEKKLTIACAAEKAGMGRVYEDHYRIYCRYTHGAWLASSGELDKATDPADNRAMAVNALIALDNLVSLGAESPNRDRLFRRLKAP